MRGEEKSRRGWLLLPVFAILLIAIFAFVAPARTAGRRFFDSLRLPPPTRVNVGISASAGAAGNRSLQQVVSDMVTDKPGVLRDESDQDAASADAASKMAGFAAQLPIRKDAPKLEVLGAHSVTMTIDRTRLQTIFEEAGRSNVTVPATADGGQIAVEDPKTIRAQYGNCPVPDNSLGAQITGPPPPSTDNTDCVVLVEGPAVTVRAPAGLDMQPLVEIALELSGMNPQQTQAFLQSFDWKSTLSLAMPRFIRSYELVDVKGSHGMLLSTAWRRGPTWVLIWAKDGMVYSLTGYGNSAEAAPLANSVK